MSDTLFTVHFTLGADGTVHADQAILRDGQEREDLTLTAEEDVIRGGLSLTKLDSVTGTSPQGEASFAGIRFAVISDSPQPVTVRPDGRDVTVRRGEVAWILTADENGQASTGPADLPFGDYLVKELRQDELPEIGSPLKEGSDLMANPFYLWSGQTRTVRIRENGVTVAADAFSDDVPHGGVTVLKRDSLTGSVPQGDASFAGVRFEILNHSSVPLIVGGKTFAPGESILTIVSDENGTASSAQDALPFGEYLIRESAAGPGYRLNESLSYVFRIREDGVSVPYDSDGREMIFGNEVMRAVLHFRKTDARTDAPQGQADFAGIRIAVVSAAANPLIYGGRSYRPGEIVAVMTLNEDGQGTLPEALPYGQYLACELRADASAAHGELSEGSENLGRSVLANDSYLFGGESRPCSAEEDGSEILLGWSNEVVRGGLRLTKRDAACETAQGGASLAGIRFEVVSLNGSVWAGGVLCEEGETVLTLTTDENGTAASAADALPFGLYQIRETASNGSYRLTDRSVRTVQIRENGTLVSADTDGNELIFRNEVIQGKVLIRKIDAETGLAEPVGGASLAGIGFTLVNRSGAAILYEGRTVSDGAVIDCLTTDEKGLAESALLPFGRYEVYESASNGSYLPDETGSRFFLIREDGSLTQEDEAGQPLIFADQPVRGDFHFVKKDYEHQTSMPLIPWRLTHLTTGEVHYILTDQNGVFDSAACEPTHHTNANDGVLSEYGTAGVIPQDVLDALDREAGLWFGLGQNGTSVPPAAGAGALPPGEYLLEEMRTESNRGKDLVTDTLTVTRAGYNVPFGTIFNKDTPTEPETTEPETAPPETTAVPETEPETAPPETTAVPETEPETAPPETTAAPPQTEAEAPPETGDEAPAAPYIAFAGSALAAACLPLIRRRKE